ncbi:CoA transferase subunit A [Nonomuraea longicatena]|uniref:CoA transferase subunit A n=1 Tax=Nonomuraea longicatena TaxID=83682 RepID=A0ABP4BK57_9ACTN
MDKVVGSARAAVADVGDGASLAVGGFGLAGVPSVLIGAILARGSRELHVVSNNCGLDGQGLGELLAARRIGRVTASYVGNNREFARQYLAGELEVELIPQGTLAERLRAGGSGIPALYTRAGVGTAVEEGGLPWRYHADGRVAVASPPREVREFDGVPYVLERAMVTDFGLVHAARGDIYGNLVFSKAARNFNPLVAMAGRVTIAQVEELCELDPGEVHLPGVFVQRVVVTGPVDKPIERMTTRVDQG